MAIQDILFLDIETVPQEAQYDDLSNRNRELWDKKAAFINRHDEAIPSEVYERAGIYAEFGKVISIAMGYITQKNSTRNLRITDISGHNEKELLLEFKALLDKKFNSKNLKLCAHNGKEFDFPYLARRMIINQIDLPECLQLSGKKPWEIRHADTLEMWKFGDYKHFTSLDLLSSVLGIESSKDDIDGSQVYHVYYEEKDLQRIARYCQRDVAVLAQVYLRLTGQPILADEHIIFVG